MKKFSGWMIFSLIVIIFAVYNISRAVYKINTNKKTIESGKADVNTGLGTLGNTFLIFLNAILLIPFLIVFMVLYSKAPNS